MAFRFGLRALKPFRSLSPPSLCSRRLYSELSTDENQKFGIAVNGKNIKYVRAGNGDHVVLCLPGALGSAWTDFKPQIEGLDPEVFTVIAWDPPGYGHSRPPNKDFSKGFLNRDADDAASFMKALNFPKFSILGWSDGGMTGMILASKYPEHMRKLAVWGSNAYVTAEEAEIFKKMRDVSTWSKAMKAKMVELYGEDDFRIMWEQWVDEFVRIREEDDGDVCRNEVKSIKCPLFVLHGKKDPLVLPEHPQYIISNVPGAQYHVFEEGKHNIHIRYADEFNSLINKFLTSETNSGIADHRLYPRLPPFKPDNAAVWFAQTEAQFHLSDISDDLTKFNCVLSQLDTKHAARVENVICDPPRHGKYELLKTELISRLKEDQRRKALSNAKIGHMKPSEYLTHLRELAGTDETLLHLAWLEGLPSRVKSIVKTQSVPLDSLAELADMIVEIDRQTTAVDLSSIERRLDVVCKQLTALAEVRGRASRRTSLSAPHAPTPKLRKASRDQSGSDFIGNTSDAFCDVIGLPLPGSEFSKDVIQALEAPSRYQSLLTDFPGLLRPSEGPVEVRHQVKHRITKKSGSAESISPFRLTEVETTIARDVIDSMIRNGTAQPSSSPYGSALRVIRGAVLGSSGWHVLGDYRCLNNDTVSDTYKIRHPVEISDSLWGCNVFSVIKLRKDWAKIPLAPEDISKTAVVTPFGKFEFPFMPRGLLNSSRTWQRVLDEVLQGLPFCFGYLDAILVFSHTNEEHLEHIRAIFQRLSSNGICLKPSTSVFGESHVKFFNYSVSGSGFAPIPDLIVKAMEDIRPPRTIADIGRFVRMNNVYRRYIPISLDGPLRNLINQSEVDYSAPVTWTSELEQAFADCKSSLARAALHSKPDPFAPMSISLSVGNHAIGAVLNQTHLGLSVPLAFFTQMLTPEQKRNSAYNRYLLATYESVKAFRSFVAGRNFTILLDLSFGVSILEKGRIASPAMFWYAAYCSQFTTDVQYVRPFDNAVARCLAALVKTSDASESYSSGSAQTQRLALCQSNSSS